MQNTNKTVFFRWTSVFFTMLLAVTMFYSADPCQAQIGFEQRLSMPDDISGYVRFNDTAWGCSNFQKVDNALIFPQEISLSKITANGLPESANIIDSTRKMGVVLINPQKAGGFFPVVFVPIKSEDLFVKKPDNFLVKVGTNDWNVTPKGPGYQLTNEKVGFITYLIVHQPTNTAIFCSDWKLIERLFSWFKENRHQEFMQTKGLGANLEMKEMVDFAIDMPPLINWSEAAIRNQVSSWLAMSKKIPKIRSSLALSPVK